MVLSSFGENIKKIYQCKPEIMLIMSRILYGYIIIFLLNQASMLTKDSKMFYITFTLELFAIYRETATYYKWSSAMAIKYTSFRNGVSSFVYLQMKSSSFSFINKMLIKFENMISVDIDVDVDVDGSSISGWP